MGQLGSAEHLDQGALPIGGRRVEAALNGDPLRRLVALRVVERYYGRDVAQKTAYNMEYQGQGWMNPNSNQIYAQAPVSTAEHPLCSVCGMDVDPKTAPKSVYKGTTYYFCSDDDKKTFDAAPDRFVNADKKL